MNAIVQSFYPETDRFAGKEAIEAYRSIKSSDECLALSGISAPGSKDVAQRAFPDDT